MTDRYREILRSTTRSSVVFALTLATAQGVAGQTVQEVVDSSRSVIRSFMSEHGVPGLSIAVSVHGELVWSEGFGLADVEDDVPVTPATRFRIGSVSKVLTSASVGLLLQQGLLDIDAPVQAYVPSFPEKEYPVTTRQLGGHVSGLPHYGDEDFVNVVRYESVVAALDKFKDRALLFPPGERFHYSSFGFNLVSAVVEGAAGVPFLEYMESAVFEPLGMTRTVADDYREVIPDRTDFYERSQSGALMHAPFTDNSDVWAGGGFLSTSPDLVAFAVGLLRGDLLDEETLEVLFTPTATTGDEPSPYGLGWRVYSPGGPRVLGHRGGHFGAVADLFLVPSEGVVVAMLANLSGAPLVTLRAAIIPMFLGLEG